MNTLQGDEGNDLFNGREDSDIIKYDNDHLDRKLMKESSGDDLTTAEAGDGTVTARWVDDAVYGETDANLKLI